MCCCYVDGPIVECDSTEADINQFNVYLRCLVRARPSVTSLFWIADVNRTAVSNDDVTSDYWSTVTVCCAVLSTRSAAAVSAKCSFLRQSSTFHRYAAIS